MKVFAYLIAVFCLVACESKSNNNSQNTGTRHVYFYYPKPNVYVDTVEKKFIYFDSASKKWVTGNPSITVMSNLGKSVLLDSTAPQPVWSANAEHRMVYAATLYADSSDFKEPPPVVKKNRKKEEDRRQRAGTSRASGQKENTPW